MKNKEQVSKEKNNSILTLFLVFLKIGAFTFGGGYAMIPLIQREVVETRKWLNDDDILDIIAIAESTPGPIAINSATFVGYRVAGFWGSLVSTLGVVLPSVVIILLVSYLLAAFEEYKVIKYAFWGIRARVLALLCKAWWGMFKKLKKTVVSIFIAVCAFALTSFLGIDSIFVIIGCAVFGLVSSLIMERRDKQ